MEQSYINTPVKCDTKISITYDSIHKLNPEFSLCDVDVMYVDENRNGTVITKDVVENAMYSLYGVPIVGEWLENEGRFGDHGQKLEITSEGMKMVVTTKPIGFVTQEAIDSAEWIEKPLPNGHEMKTWLRLHKCILWTGRYQEAQSIIDNGTYQSMEVKFDDGMYTEDGLFKATKMTFSALCAIGVEPCFEEANIRRADYSMDSFKAELQSMLNEYKKYGLENSTDQNVHDTKEEQSMNYENVISEISNVKISDEVSQYSVIECTEDCVTVFDKADCSVYAIAYSVETEEEAEKIVFDYENKIEKALSVSDKTEESYDFKSQITSAMDIYANGKVSMAIEKAVEETEKTADEKYANTITELNEKYSALETEYNSLKSDMCKATEKLEAYAEAERVAQNELHKADINTVIDSYASKLGNNAEYLMYKTQIDYAKTKEQVDVDMLMILGKATRDNKVSNFAYTPKTWGTNPVKEENVTNRYGNLFDKIAK